MAYIFTCAVNSMVGSKLLLRFGEGFGQSRNAQAHGCFISEGHFLARTEYLHSIALPFVYRRRLK